MTRRRRLLRRQYHKAKYLVLSIINRLLVFSFRHPRVQEHVKGGPKGDETEWTERINHTMV